MNFNLYTVDVPSIEDGPWSSDIGNDLKNNMKMNLRDTSSLPFEISCPPLPSDASHSHVM